MTPEAAKELDRNFVLSWLSKIYSNPSMAYETYTPEQHKICAYDAVVLLSGQTPVKPVRSKKLPRCWACGNCGTYVGFEDSDPTDPNEFDNYCRKCGRPVLWGKEINDAKRSDL